MARTERKLLDFFRSHVGKLVRLRFPIKTKGGTEYPAGMLFRVSSTWRGKFVICGALPTGEDEIKSDGCLAAYVRGVPLRDLEVLPLQPVQEQVST